MEAAARSLSSQVRRSKKRRPGTTAVAQIDVGIEAAAGSASRRAKPRPRRTRRTVQIDVLPAAFGIETAAAVSASHIPRRRRTAQIGIPSRRAKTVRPHPVSNPPPDPNWGVVSPVRGARSSFPDLDSNKRTSTTDDHLLLLPRHNWRDLGDPARSSPQDLDDDDDSDNLQPLPRPNRNARRARPPRDLDDGDSNEPLPLPCPNRDAKRARTDLPWRDWSDLGDGPAGLIAERILAHDVADYLRFRAVCRPWRQSCTEPRTHSGLDRRFHPWRWTMLREELAAPDRRSFLNTSTGECVQVDIPELHDHKLLALTPEGLLVLVHDCKYIRLLNPLTRHLTELPPLATLLPPKDHRSLLERTAYFNTYCPAWGSGIADDDSTFVLCFDKLSMLGMAKPGDHRWKVLRYHGVGQITAPIMIAGRFYCVTHNAVKTLETDPDRPQLNVAAKLKNMHISPRADSLHLVNNCGELMLLHRHGGPLTMVNKSGWAYDMYRVDLNAKTLVPVKSLGGAGRALFVGMSCSLSVSLEVFPYGSISADTIYLSFDFPERDIEDVGAYHLADGSIEVPCSLVQPHTLVDCLSLSNTVS